MKKPSSSKKRKPAKKKPRATTQKKARSGLSFELRARRAIAQVHPGLVVTHDEKLSTEYGVERQFDVVGRSADAVTSIYEARDKRRKVDVQQQEAFAMKIAKLAAKPERAGIISASGFTSSTKRWVEYYNGSEIATELYTLTPASIEDWKGDIREYLVTASIQTVRVMSVRLVPPAGLTVGERVTVTTDRAGSFIRNGAGLVVGNLLDVINEAIRDAQASNDMSPRRFVFPDDSYIEVDCGRSCFQAVELELEQVVIPATTRIDLSGRFPDTLRDAVRGRHWLIEDQERLPRFARNGRDLSLEFRSGNDGAFVDLYALPVPDPDPDFGSTVESTVASLQLDLALTLAGGRAEESASAELAALLERARTDFEAGNFSAAEAVYLESLGLGQGTALAALCNLAYIVDQRGDHEKAAHYSLLACRLFPMQPYGFANAAAAFLASDKLVEARRVLNMGRPLHGPAYVFRRQEADLLSREARWKEAATAYYGVLLDDPADARVRAGLARCEAALGNVAAAAWDARRAMLDARAQPLYVEMASLYAARDGNSEMVLEVAADAASVGLAAPDSYRRAAACVVAAGDYRSAIGWLDRIPRDSWSATDYALSGQCASLTGDHTRAIKHLQQAEGCPDVSADVRPWLAENLCGAGQVDDAMAVLGRMEPETASRLVIDLLDQSYAAGRHKDCESLGRWLMSRETAVPAALLRQARVLVFRAMSAGDAASLLLAEERLALATVVGPPHVEVVAVWLMLAIARGDEAAALGLLGQLPSDAVDLCAVLVTFAEQRDMVEVWSAMLDRCLAAKRVPPHVDISLLVAARVGCGFRLGHPVATVRVAVGARVLSTDAWAQAAEAALAYAEGDVDACVRVLRPVMANPKVPFFAPQLFGQALAELGRYHELQAHWRAFDAPVLVDLARWAAARRPDRPLEPFEVGLSSAASFMHDSEFLGIAVKSRVRLSVPASDWAGALAGSREHEPSAIWVARRSYPREFLRRVFTPPKGHPKTAE